MGEEDIRRQALQCVQHAVVGGRSPAGDQRFADPARRDQRGNAQLDELGRNDALHFGLGRRAASVSADRPRFSVGDRPRNDRTMPRSSWAVCRTWSWPASGAAATRPECSIRLSITREVELLGVEAGGRAIFPATTPRPSPFGNGACCTAATAMSCRTKTGKPRRAFGLGWARLSRRGPRAQLLERHRPREYTPVQRRRRAGRVHHPGPNEGILPALESSHAVAQALKLAAAARRREIIVICLSGRGDKDAAEVALLSKLSGHGARRVPT